MAAEDGSTAMSQAFDDELQATMVVVAAAAFASTRSTRSWTTCLIRRAPSS